MSANGLCWHWPMISLFGNVELIVDLVVQRQGRLTIRVLVQPKEISFQEILNR